MEKKEKILGTSKVTRRYQITIPKAVRAFLEVNQGDIIVFVFKNGEIVIRKGT